MCSAALLQTAEYEMRQSHTEKYPCKATQHVKSLTYPVAALDGYQRPLNLPVCTCVLSQGPFVCAMCDSKNTDYPTNNMSPKLNDHRQ